MTQEINETNYSGQNIWPLDNYPYRRMFNATDTLTTFKGRRLTAQSLRTCGDFSTLGPIITRAFGTSPYGLPRKVFSEVLACVGEYNESAKPTRRLTPALVVDSRYEKPKTSYILPNDQVNQLVRVLKSNKDRFDPLLPFRITDEEIIRLHAGDGEMVEKAILRMHRLGLSLTNELPTETALRLVEEVINNGATWKALLEARHPRGNNFRNYFWTSVYRRKVNYHRDQGNAVKMQQRQVEYSTLRGSPLEQFFTENEVGTVVAERLLGILTMAERAHFVERYINKYKAQPWQGKVAESVKSRLEEVASLPQEEWTPLNHVTAMSTLLKYNQPFYEAVVTKLSLRNNAIVNLRYGGGKTHAQIAARVGSTYGAIKAADHRMLRQMVAIAVQRDLVKASDFELHIPEVAKTQQGYKQQGYIFAREVSQEFGLSRRKIRQLFEDGSLKGVKTRRGIWLTGESVSKLKVKSRQ